MAGFDAGDDEGLRRLLDRLPADFALAGTVAECRRLIAGDGDGGDAGGSDGAGGAGTPGALGSGKARVAALAGEVRRALRKGNVRALGTAIEKLADALYPDDPLQARIDLLAIAALAAAQEAFPVTGIKGLAERLLPAERLSSMLARLLLLREEAKPESWSPTPAVLLLQELPAEFPRPEDHPLARASILESLARTGRAAVDPVSLPLQKQALVARLVGRPIEDPATIFSELMTASLEADPGNRDGSLFLLSLLREQGAGKPQRMRVLQEMTERFPTIRDPGWSWPGCSTRGTPTAAPRARWRRRAGAPRTTTGSWTCRPSASSSPPTRVARRGASPSRHRTSGARRTWDASFSRPCCP